MKGQATNGLILVGVIVIVAGVAWLRTAREDGPAAGNEATAAVDPVAPAAATAPARDGELCPEPLPAETGGPASPPVPERGSSAPSSSAQVDDKSAAIPVASTGEPALVKKRPRVVDLGAGKCKACIELAPILEQLKKEYAGRVDVEFIDVWKNPKAGEPYKIRVIPTQIFYTADGKEVWRHEGFLPKTDFIAKFKELGVK